MNENFNEFSLPFNDFLIKYYGKKSIKGIEIGVETGLNAVKLLNTLNIEKLYLIDPYREYIEEMGGDRLKRNLQLSCRVNLLKSKRNLKNYKNIERIFEDSSDAIKDIKELCDFVYIDGNHSYDFVKKDIELYKDIIKKGGVIGGDDYIDKWFGVIKAVDEFIKKTGYTLYLEKYKVSTGKNELGYFYDQNWWIIKE